VSYKKEELLNRREHLDSPLIFAGVRFAHLFNFLFCVVFLCFVCLRPVSCVHNAASVSGLSIRDGLFGFL
jgi:hypothetical protein